LYQISHADGLGAYISLRDDAQTEDVKLSTFGDSFFMGGDVGIGTNVIDNKLEIGGGHIEIENDDMDSKIRFHDPGNYWYSMGIDQSDGGKFKISWGGDVGEENHFVLNSTTGDIGIGTNNPVGTLDVNGDICIAGDCISTWPSGGSGTPAGAIMQFYLNTCPVGWKPADGTNGTPDLRGAFVRGMETFDAGSTYNNRDPNRSGAGTSGSYQGDEFYDHFHTSGGGATYGVAAGGSYNLLAPGSTDSAGGNETRPKNVALIFCQKE